MVLQELDINKLSKLTSQQIDHVTCIECCKYFTVPTTALCGHTLCHTCWRGRHTCPSCGVENDKKSLKLNLPLQNLTKHVQNLCESFEELFKIKLDEFLLDTPGDNVIQQDPNKNIHEWLTSSQNHFSVPPTNSLQSTQDSSAYVEHVTSHVQVHSENKKKPTPMEIQYAPRVQHDWDKIEEMPDSENKPKNNKENVVGPMDIEPFDFIIDDKEYSVENPRRSFRNKENNNNNMSNISNEIVSNVNCHSSSSMDTNKKSHKTMKSWNNVKRMKREFSKLNKQNKNKLNVSIEMCKKTPISANKIVERNVSQPVYSIDDNTPEVAIDNNDECDIKAVLKSNTDKENISNVNDLHENHISKKTVSIDVSNINKSNERVFNLPKVIENREKNNENDKKVTFFKRSAFLSTNKYNMKHDLNNEQNSSGINTDDIEITIKVGNTLTNIYIKKKDNDVQLNVQTDREIQTSLKDLKTQVKEIDVKTGEKKTQKQDSNIDVISPKNVHPTQSTLTKTDLNKFEKKSESIKKNTASADTSTAAEITASVEKELFQTMGNSVSQKKRTNTSTQSASQALKEIEQNVAELNDLDIFDSESVKEGNIQPLKVINGTQSAILMPTYKSHMDKERNPEKRNRDENDIEAPITKRMKTVNEINDSDIIEDNSEGHRKQNTIQCSELDNYNEIISQVFANIDADIVHMQKNKNNQKKESQSTNKRFNRSEILNASQSENVFSIVEKDIDGYETGGKKKDVPRGSQKIKCIDENIDNTEPQTSKKSSPNDSDIIVQSTPIQEDALSDHSVVEETPQKSASFSKVKSRGDPSKSNSKLSTYKAKSLEQKSQPKEIIIEHDSNVITLSDTLVDASKNVSVTDKIKERTLETPVTINKFVNHIKYKSTPVAKKSLDFDVENKEDHEQTFCSSFVAAKTTQEKEFMSKAFEQCDSPSSTLVPRRVGPKDLKYCIAGSCLSSQQQVNVKKLCAQKNWTFTEKYTKDLTHLVVGVDDENKSQRSVKFMCALAASKWIVSYEWVAKCLQTTEVADEEAFEALDGTGEPGPRRSRTASQKLFEGITFYCMPPFSVLDELTLKEMLTAAGGCVAEQAAPAPARAAPALLLAEPEHTQEDRFIYLAMEHSVVPVNYEWALNCLGSYTLSSIHELLLCPASLLPKVTNKWPPALIARDDE